MTDEPKYGGLTALEIRKLLADELEDEHFNEDYGLIDALDRIERLEAERDDIKKQLEDARERIAELEDGLKPLADQAWQAYDPPHISYDDLPAGSLRAWRLLGRGGLR